MARTEPCKKCGKEIDTRGLKAHEKNCKGKPGKVRGEVVPKAEETPPEVPPKVPETIPEPIPEKQEAQPETIVIKQDFSEVPALPEQMQQTEAKGDTVSPVFTGGKADIFDFDAEDCGNAYGALFEIGVLVATNKEFSLSDERIKKRGQQLKNIMEKYNLKMKYMDLMFLGAGVASDISLAVMQTKGTEKVAEKDALKTDGTKHEIIEQPKAPEKPKSLLSAGAVKAP